MAVPKRRMKLISEGEVREATVRSNKQASQLGQYWNAIGEFMQGRRANLADFEGVTIANQPLETDTDLLEDLYLDGAIDIEDVYAEASPGASS